jgi:uncharacterized membrane protein YbaN (DUF454 family)
MSRIAMLTLGYAFLGLGVLGMFLPILQGFLFLAIGLVILSRHAPWAQRLVDRLKRKYPRLGAKLDAAEAKAQAIQESSAGRLRAGRASLKRMWCTALGGRR